MLDIFHWKWLKIVTFQMICLQLFNVCFEIVILDFGSHFLLETRFFVEIVIYFLLMPHKSFIFTHNLQLHQIFRYDLLSLNWMEELLVCDQVPCSFFGVLQLTKLDYQDILELFEVLFHVFYSDTTRRVK